MKFDKETVIAVVLCIVFVMGWVPFCKMMGWIPEQSPQTPPAAVQTVQEPESITTKPVAVTTPSSVNDESGNKNLVDLPLQQLHNEFVTILIDPVKGEVTKVVFDKHFKGDHKENIKLDGSLSGRPGIMSLSSKSQDWVVKEIVENNLSEANTYRLIRRIAIDNQDVLVKQYWKISGNYSLDYNVELKNLSDQNIKVRDLKIGGGTLEPFSLMSGDMVRGETLSLEFMTEDNAVKNIGVTSNDAKFNFKPELPVKWSALINRYFMTILLAESKPFSTIDQYHEQKIPVTSSEKELLGGNFLSKMFGGTPSYYKADVGGVYKELTLAPQQNETLNFKSYLGPKIASEVNAFDPSVSYTLRLMSWRPMNALAKVMLWSLLSLKSFCGSYGWAIIMLTIIVRLLVWPVTHKANVSMKKMQSFQPEIKAIREQHKDNPQLMNSKMMELYKREKINPMRGCLPLLLQLPIFMALYFSLDSVVELRHVSFLWAQDLSQPDTIFEIGGFAVNPLVLMMTGLMIMQQKMMPQAGDPMQQKMMLFMPVMMLLILYNLPSALTLYWTVSQVFSILQMLLTQKLTKNINNKATTDKPVKA
ncbi:MAG: YidC/Oxa1 family insertase periplasmic-domain containing protein [Victivallaceae bacterium]|nr:YidC/Oxa1 family insertase periplasmic-domain containing protein [Victivallaceae bacterium]MDD4182062.1 YidC/Oxa1 family insertase periplasmic-domain containing protein [Victivallaceae bacterium]